VACSSGAFHLATGRAGGKAKGILYCEKMQCNSEFIIGCVGGGKSERAGEHKVPPGRVEVVREGNGGEEASVNVEDSCRPHRLFRAEGMKGRDGKGREGKGRLSNVKLLIS
jgi:hypothetical protein